MALDLDTYLIEEQKNRLLQLNEIDEMRKEALYHIELIQ